MKRHPALIPFSHDHHDGLVHARRLRRAADVDPDARRDMVAAFLAFADQELEPHFTEEERVLAEVAPYVDTAGGARLAPHVERVTRDHDSIRAAWQELREGIAGDAVVPGEAVSNLGEQLHDHIRFEERELFSVLQSVVPDAALTAAATHGAEPQADEAANAVIGEQPQPVVGALRADLRTLGAARRGIPWSAASRDLNVTCLSWEPGHRIEAHRTSDRDIVVIGIDGSGTVTVDGIDQHVDPGTIVISPAGAERSIEAGPDGFVYLSMHKRREPMLPERITRD